MKDENNTPQPWIDPALEARIVASVLGETSAFEAAEIERLVATHPELALFKRRIEATHGLLQKTSQPENPKLRLSPERRRKLLETIGVPAVAPPEKVHVIATPSPWWSSPLMVRAAACLIMIGLAVALLSSVTEFKSTRRESLDFVGSDGGFVQSEPASPAQSMPLSAPSSGVASSTITTAPVLGDVPMSGRLFREGDGLAVAETGESNRSPELSVNQLRSTNTYTGGVFTPARPSAAPLELAKSEQKPQKRRAVSSWDDEPPMEQAAAVSEKTLDMAVETAPRDSDSAPSYRGAHADTGIADPAATLLARPSPEPAATPAPANEQSLARLADLAEKVVIGQIAETAGSDGVVSWDGKSFGGTQSEGVLEKELSTRLQEKETPLDGSVAQLAQQYAGEREKDQKNENTDLRKNFEGKSKTVIVDAQSALAPSTASAPLAGMSSQELSARQEAPAWGRARAKAERIGAAPDQVPELQVRLQEKKPLQAELREEAGKDLSESAPHLASGNKVSADKAALHAEIKRLEQNAKTMVEGSMLQGGAAGSTKGGAAQGGQTKRDMDLQPVLTRIAELQAQLKSDQLVKEVTAAHVNKGQAAVAAEPATNANSLDVLANAVSGDAPSTPTDFETGSGELFEGKTSQANERTDANAEKPKAKPEEGWDSLYMYRGVNILAGKDQPGEAPKALAAGTAISANSMDAPVAGLVTASDIVNQPVFSTRDGKPVEFDSYINYGSPIKTIDATDAQKTEELNRLLEEGKGFQDTGRYDLAQKRFEQTLTLDASNSAAREGLGEVAKAKAKYHASAYNQTRSRMLWEVDQSWERPVRRFANGGSTSTALGVLTGTRGTEAIVSKLNRIIIPRIDFREATIRDAVDFLNQRSRDLDTAVDGAVDKKGVKIVLKLDDAPTAAAPDPTVAPSRPPVTGGNEDTRITLSLTNVPLNEALRYLTELSGLKYKVDPYAVSIVPLAESTMELVTKEYVVPPGFIPNSPQRNPSAKPGSKAVPSTGSGAREYFESIGIMFPPGTTVAYIANSNKLIVKNTIANLDIIDALVESANDTSNAQAFGDEITTSKEPFSTFSLHVSDVSFQLAKDALARGSRPDPSRIRAEEFYNAFDYNDPAPGVGEEVACRIEQSAHPFLQQRNLARIAIKVAAAGRAAGQPLRLTILLDTSGSMEREDRAASVRRALQSLVSLLGPNDRVTLIGFARTPRLLAEDVPGDQGSKLVEAADRTPSQGGTNLEEALALASELALKHRLPNGQNRIVLLTDGAANLGNANPDRLAQQIDKTRQQGISFDACGVGAKGLNDEILEALTRKGDGRYYFLNKPEDADEGFARQLAGAFRPAAENVKVQVVFNPNRVAGYRLIGFEKHLLEKEDFRNDKVQAAELSAEEAGVALYQFQPLPEGSGELGEVFVRFRDPATGKMVERSWTMPYDERVPSFDQASPSLQLAATAALLAEKLSGNDQIDLNTLAPVLNGLRGRYGEQQRVGELLRMFEQARR